MLTPRVYVAAFDYTAGSFVSSIVYTTGIYHHGWYTDPDGLCQQNKPK